MFVDALFDLLIAVLGKAEAILGNPVASNPILRALFDLVGASKLTYGQLVCTLFAIPAVVAYEVTHKGKGRPFQPLSSPRGRVVTTTSTRGSVSRRAR